MSENAFLELAGPGRSSFSLLLPLPLLSPHPPFFFFFLLTAKPKHHALTSSGAAAKWQEPAGPAAGHRTRHGLPKPGVVLLGAAEFGFSPSRFQVSLLQGTGVQGRWLLAGGGWGGGNRLCPPLPPEQSLRLLTWITGRRGNRG